MKALRAFLCLILILFVISPLIHAQSKETGALQGVIRLEDGNPVPGVLVTISSETVMGATRTTISNQDGQYRFAGIQPGTYSVSASLEGFASARQSGIKIHLGKTFSVDLIMTQGKITEEIEVMARSPLVDVRSSSTATVEMPTEFLQNVPNAQFTTEAVNLAPGVTKNVAYGAAQGTGISYQIDGVDVKDPASGTAWVFLDYNVVEEISISGIGAPAEYGGFTGVVFNTVTKSGGNSFKGYSEILYQSKKWNSKNSSDPSFAPGATDFYSVHLDVGGPIVKDKLSFFASALYYREIEQLSGTNYNLDYKQPKGFLKLTWSPSKNTRIHAFAEYDSFNGSGRDGDAHTAQDATVNQTSPEIVMNVSGQHNLSDYTFLEAKLAYFSGYYDLEPVHGRDVSGHVDWGSGENTVNSSYYYRADRTRLQGNVSVTHHAEDFIKGSHDFKFGADLMFNTERDQYGFNGGAYYADYYGEPYLKEAYGGYDVQAKMNTFAGYVQDSWAFSDRLTINPGLRIDYSRGYCLDRPDAKYITRPSIAPRIGFSFDLFGDHSTALKAHWGRYFESAYIMTLIDLSRNRGEKNEYYWDGSQWILDPSRTQPGNISQYDIADKLNQTYMDQFTVGIERQIIKDLSLGATLIYRKNHDMIAPVNDGGQYEQTQYVFPGTQETINVWNQTNTSGDNHYLITNPKKGDLSWITFTPYRKYVGLEFLLNKRFSNNWQMMASYVYSKGTGNMTNSEAVGSGYANSFENPNRLIDAEGRLGTDPTHMLKVQGSAILPLNINLNINFQMISGNTYTETVKLPSSVDSNKTEIFVEPRGSHRYPTTHILDLRLEKTFQFHNVKLGVLLDVFNLLNEGKVTSVQVRYPSFGSVLAIQKPRAFRAGLRFWF
ncbi:MAG: TonB-dependent receptor [Candidatus Omnitrophota bacterium]